MFGKNSSDSTWTKVANRIRNTTYKVDGIAAGIAYFFTIRAENSHGLSAPSQVSDPVTIGVVSLCPFWIDFLTISCLFCHIAAVVVEFKDNLLYRNNRRQVGSCGGVSKRTKDPVVVVAVGEKEKQRNRVPLRRFSVFIATRCDKRNWNSSPFLSICSVLCESRNEFKIEISVISHKTVECVPSKLFIVSSPLFAAAVKFRWRLSGWEASSTWSQK